MIHATTLGDKYQKRPLRGEYVHTQGYPYDVQLDPSLFNTDGSIRLPLSSDTTPLSRTANAFSLKGGLLPGMVLVRTTDELVAIATGNNTAEKPFGLLANFCGGNFDDLREPNNTKVGAWRGLDSTFTILAPGFNDAGGDGTTLSAAYASAANTGIPVKLYAGTDGRLTNYTTPGNRVAVADLVQRVSASRIVVSLLI